jgi:hypothetical protein
MSSNTTVTQPVLPAILLAFPETYIVPFLLPLCCVAGLFVTKRDLYPAAWPGSRWNHIKERTTCLHPIFTSRIAIVPIVSPKPKPE